jgi:hypothetical protein
MNDPTISRSEAKRRLGYNHAGESDERLTAMLRQIGDMSVVRSRGNAPCRAGSPIMPCWSGNGYCIDEGYDHEDGRLGEHIDD